MKYLILLLFVASSSLAFTSDKAEIIQSPGCGDGSHMYNQKNGNFALFLSCEDALGKYASVVFFKKMGSDSVGKWNASERFWREKAWGDSILDFAWIDKDQLLVSTSGVDENPGLYLISLPTKTSKKILVPKNAEADLRIRDIKSGVIFLSEDFEGKSFPRELKFDAAKK